MNTLPNYVHFLELDDYHFVLFVWRIFFPRTEMYIVDKRNRMTYAARIDE